MANVLTHIQIVNILEDFSKRSEILNWFFVGSNSQFEANEDIQFPCLHINLDSARMPITSYGEFKTIELRYRARVLDILRDDSSNREHIISDGQRVASDLLNELNQHPYYIRSNASISSDIDYSILDEETGHNLAGVEIVFTIKLINNNVFCGLPLEDITGYSSAGVMASGYSASVSYLQCSNLTGCTSFQDYITNAISAIPISPTVTASNGLSKIGNNIVLGGTLTGSTSVDGNGNDLIFNNNSNINLFTTGSTTIGNNDTVTNATLTLAQNVGNLIVNDGSSNNVFTLGVLGNMNFSQYDLNDYTNNTAASSQQYLFPGFLGQSWLAKNGVVENQLIHTTAQFAVTYDSFARIPLNVRRNNPNGEGILESLPTYSYITNTDILNGVVGVNSTGEFFNTGYQLASLTALTGTVLTRIQNGLNTYTGGTANAPTVNISGATLGFLKATGATTFSGVTAQTLNVLSTIVANNSVQALSVMFTPVMQADTIYPQGGNTNLNVSTRPGTLTDIVLKSSGSTPLETMRLTSGGSVNIGSGVTSGQRKLRISQDTSFLDIGSWVALTPNPAMYFNQVTPGGNNYSIGGSNSILYLNAPVLSGETRLRVFGNDVAIITNNLFNVLTGATLSATTISLSNGGGLYGADAIGTQRTLLSWIGENIRIFGRPGISDIYLDPTSGSSIGMYIKGSNGSVGIGTGSPSSKLHVIGNALFSSSTTTRIDLYSGAGVRTYIGADGAGSSFGSLTNHNTLLYSNNAERVRILSTGEVGINVTAPTAILHVSGVSRFDDGTIAGGIQLRARTTDASAAAIYMSQATPAQNNYTLISTTNTTVLNGPAVTQAAVAGTAIVTLRGVTTGTANSWFVGQQIASTNLPASTESTGVLWSNNSKQFATGNIGIQREFLITPMTYTALGSSVFTNVYSQYIQSSIASTNVSIINNWAAGFEGNVQIISSGGTNKYLEVIGTAGQKTRIGSDGSGSFFGSATNVPTRLVVNNGAFNPITLSVSGNTNIENKMFVGNSSTVPTAYVTITASTANVAALRLMSGATVTSPNDGDIWYDGTNIKCFIGGVVKTII